MIIQVKHGNKILSVEVPDTDVTLGELKEAIHRESGVIPALQKLLGKPNLAQKNDASRLSELGIKANTKLMLIGSAPEAILATHSGSHSTGYLTPALPLGNNNNNNNNNNNTATEMRANRALLYGDLFERRKEVLSGTPLWRMPFVTGALIEKYVDDTMAAIIKKKELKKKNNSLGMALLSEAVAAAGGGPPLPPHLASFYTPKKHFLWPDRSSESAEVIQKIYLILSEGILLGEALENIDSPEELKKLVDEFVGRLENIGNGTFMMVPAGWTGMKSENKVTLLIQRNEETSYTMIVVNGGSEGQRYHPRWPSAETMKICPFLKLPNIQKNRIMNRTFWFMLLSLFVRANDPANRSEFIREEVFYDVFLPWLVEANVTNEDFSSMQFATEMALSSSTTALSTSLTTANSANNTDSHTTSPFCLPHQTSSLTCSNSSAIRSPMKAVYYMAGEAQKLTSEELKQLKYIFRYEFYKRMAEDLMRVASIYLPDDAWVPPSATLPIERHSHTTRLEASKVSQLARVMEEMRTLGLSPPLSQLYLSPALEAAKKANVLLRNSRNVVIPSEQLKKKVIFLYVGTLEAPECKRLAESIQGTFKAITDTITRYGLTPADFFFLSADKNKDKFEEHCDMLNMNRTTFPAIELIQELQVKTVPQLLIFHPDGYLLHDRGIKALYEDPEALLYPFGPWHGARELSETDVKFLTCASASLSHHTLKKMKHHQLPHESTRKVVQLIEAVKSIVSILPKADNNDMTQLCRTSSNTTTTTTTTTATAIINGKTQAKERIDITNGQTSLASALRKELAIPQDAQFRNVNLLPKISTMAYCGPRFHTSVPILEEISGYTKASTFSELWTVTKRSDRVIRSLWSRARNSGTASRVAVQIHIIEFITWLFTFIIPCPIPTETKIEALPQAEIAQASDFYTTDSFTELSCKGEDGAKEDMQLRILGDINFMILSYGNAWQAVEIPTRSFDSERCLIAMKMLAVFDAVARQRKGSARCATLSRLLSENGGYRLSTTLGRTNLPFSQLSSSLELTRPHHLHIRALLLRFFEAQEKTYRRVLFEMHMPDKWEIRKASDTVDFLQQFLDHCGLQLNESGLAGTSEMDKLMNWLCSSRTPLSSRNPEFLMLRDAVILTKFLGTMEMRDAQLLRRRKQMDRFATWRISFEEDAPGRQMSAGWRTKPSPPQWECVLVRGRDTDIADIVIKAFGDREIQLGEGLVLQSPIDVSRILQVENATEDDVLHAKTLPSFGGTLSSEESEILLSALTAPYVRIPLILNFFSSQNRNTYLFVPEIQTLLRAVLFEPGAYTSAERLAEADPRSVPLRLSQQQKQEIEAAHMRGDFSRRNHEECLGTTYGLLLNELQHSAGAVLQPLRSILESVSELGPSSVYSSNATYVLFVVGLVCDVLSFCRYILENKLTHQGDVIRQYQSFFLQYFEGTVQPLLYAWLSESEENSDTPTQCVIWGSLSTVYRTLWKSDMLLHMDEESGSRAKEELLVSFLQSCAFLRARHGFGLGMQRTQLASQEGDKLLSPEEKMIRFLQAQGLNTSKVTKEMLEQGKQLMLGGGRRRAVFVQIRSQYHNDTVRVPNLFHSDSNSTTESKKLKLPPADVHENLLFQYLLEDYTTITTFLDDKKPSELSRVLQNVIKAVLRDWNLPSSADKPHPQNSGGARLLRSIPNSASNLEGLEKEAEEQWSRRSPGVYVGSPESGLLFQAQTCELFWREDELKPVPDSMSHFTDFENILGKDLLQCGLVNRYENRHWVHIVGTPYDVIEWTTPDISDPGAHSPIISAGDWPQKMVESAVYLGVTYDRIVNVYEEEPWPVREERWAITLLKEVLIAAFPGGDLKYFPLAPSLQENVDMNNKDSELESQTKRARYEEGQKKQLIVPEPIKEVREMRFIMNDAPQYEEEQERSTWKEVVVSKFPEPRVEIYNLVPHARKLFRSLVFSTNQKFCLHSLALIASPRDRKNLVWSAFQAGELKRRVNNEGSLEIHRFNQLLHGREVYIPSRLLQGIIPGALLENFFFWQGEDGIFRGYPLSEERESASVLAEAQAGGDAQKQSLGSEDRWFGYALEIKLNKPNEAKVSAAVATDRANPSQSIRNSNSKPGALIEGGGATIVRRKLRRYTAIRPGPGSGSTENNDANHKQAAKQTTGEFLLNRVSSSRAFSEGSEEEHSRAGPNWESQISLLNSVLPHLPETVCEAILRRFHGDISQTIEWASDVKNGEELNQIVIQDIMRDSSDDKDKNENEEATDGEKKTSSKTGGRASNRIGSLPFVIDQEDLTLINLLDCEPLHYILRLLSSLEDCSHILAWGRPRPRHDTNSATGPSPSGESTVILESVELPRLRAKFEAQREELTGRLRLFLADQPGWRIAEEDDFSAERLERLKTLKQPFQQCLVLCNITHEVAFMVPNHDFTPMQVYSDPFNTLLLFDRSSLHWRESVASPFYLYVVHSCNSFLLCPTLASSLYYAIMQCATQLYSGSMQTLESCYTDSTFSPEESFMFSLMERTLSDSYPDAHAVRLKLAHAVQYSSNEYQWELSDELVGYLLKKRCVSAHCLLHKTEVLDLLKRCTRASPLVQSQLELFAELFKYQRAHSTHSPDSVAPLKSKTPILSRLGYPWERLGQYPWDRISPQKLKRVTYAYRKESEFQGKELLKFLWSDELLADDESGANTRLGFYFLYSLKEGVIQPSMPDELTQDADLAPTLFSLLARWFALRHARFGREEAFEGENELQPSWCSVVLQLMEYFPFEKWPAPLSDRATLSYMSHGLNLVQSSENDIDNDSSGPIFRGGRRPNTEAVMEHFNKINSLARRLFEGRFRPIVSAIASSQQRTPQTKPLMVAMHDHLKGRVLPSNTSMKSVVLDERTLGEKYFEKDKRTSTLKALLTTPLSDLPFYDSLIVSTDGLSTVERPGKLPNTDSPNGRLPFDLASHRLAQTPLAQDLLRRLEEDMSIFHSQMAHAVNYSFRVPSKDDMTTLFVTENPKDTLKTLTDTLAKCISAVKESAERNEKSVLLLTTSVLQLVNDGSHDVTAEDVSPSILEHLLERSREKRMPVPLTWLCGAVLSDHFLDDLKAINPFHGDFSQIRSELVLLMLLSNRIHFAEQCILALREVQIFVELVGLLRGEDIESDGTNDTKSTLERIKVLMRHFSIDIDGDEMRPILEARQASMNGKSKNDGVALSKEAQSLLHGRFQQLCTHTIEILRSKRHYSIPCTALDREETKEDDTLMRVEMDPRFLVFEFVFNIMLRQRQVEMVRWFVANVEAGQSRVQQMIMGQGKTTVVSPLLALILADGSQLVTQVMPPALLEQTRSILRRCFSVVIVKHIYTLHFDRSFDSGTGNNSVELILQKLKAAEENRSVVIAAPECIKSLFLKYVEQLHMLESTPTKDLDITTHDERHREQVRMLIHKSNARSAMADNISPIFDIWNRGVLIMDEVDILLHPLRSELNFPIGPKHPIDLTGFRWLLPIHLLDAIFYHQRERSSDDVSQSMKLARCALVTEEDLLDPNNALTQKRKLVLDNVSHILATGFERHALQREPHLVLLDEGFYYTELLPSLVPWIQLWLYDQMKEQLSRMNEDPGSSSLLGDFDHFSEFTKPFLLSPERRGDDPRSVLINERFSPFFIQLLILSHDWLYRLLPHVLSKIDRVSYGVLQPHDLALFSDRENMPFSRRMMAVPFVAKDVPSRSSEFAHPDVVIGLTVLAFRYEGLRQADVKSLIMQLKQDFSRQSGPKEHRPAARLYRRWLRLSEQDRTTGHRQRNPPTGGRNVVGMGTVSDTLTDRAGVPLSQLQVTDRAQMVSLQHLLAKVPEVIHYYLCSCIFPRTMVFQRLKISACGHELGSSMLFSKRIGFSGTPSNLLPLDLGECFYEPGSDGRVLSVLTDNAIAHVEVMPDNWSPLYVLERIANAQPPFHALIDAGALITNMDNEEVARFLISKLPAKTFDGVVFLDSNDRQMFFQRDNGLIVPIAQCGVPLSRRFTFFDQVHTTGTDVKQCSTALAALTLGKDLVFRDYAQAAYRMRGIGKGQRLCLYLIPEVVTLMDETLGSYKTSDGLKDVPAWLLINSMRMEGLQFFKLLLQELANVWRKKALANLVAESNFANRNEGLFTNLLRSRRFHAQHANLIHSDQAKQNLPSLAMMRLSIEEFREIIEYPVDTSIQQPKSFLEQLESMVQNRPKELVEGDITSQKMIEQLMERMVSSIQSANHAQREDPSSGLEGGKGGGGGGGRGHGAGADFQQGTTNLNAEIIHEQEAEEEQEQEAEQEEQRVSAFSRDDEVQIPWKIDTLLTCGPRTGSETMLQEGNCFYPVNQFQIQASQPSLSVGTSFKMSDNFFRLSWHGVGARRLKNTHLFIQWAPLGKPLNETFEADKPEQEPQPSEQQHDEEAKGAEQHENNLLDGFDHSSLCSGLVTLSEGESIRWLLHHSSHVAKKHCLCLRFVSNGRYMDATKLFLSFAGSSNRAPVKEGTPIIEGMETKNDPTALLYRFLNNDMFFSTEQIQILEDLFSSMVPNDRLEFFSECLRARRRHRNHWEDAPVASLFLPSDKKMFGRHLAIFKKMEYSFNEMLTTLIEASIGDASIEKADAAAKIRDRIDIFVQKLEKAMKGITENRDTAKEPIKGAPGDALPSEIGDLLSNAFPDILKEFSSMEIYQAIVFDISTTTPSASSTSPPGREATPTLTQLYRQFPVLNIHHVTDLIQSKLQASATKASMPSVPWHCELCTFVNEPAISICAMCGNVQSNALSHTSDNTNNVRNTKEPNNSEDTADSPWACETCTFINESRKQLHCSICLAPNHSVLQSKTATSDGMTNWSQWECPEGHWVCSVERGGCSKFNSNDLFYCQVCEKARPNLASIRF